MGFTKDLLANSSEDCVVHECKSPRGCTQVFAKAGARFSLDGSPSPHALLDFDKPPLVDPNRSRCDYLLAADGGSRKDGWLAFVEVTSGKKGAGEACRQIQSSMDLVENLVPQGRSLLVRAVVVGTMGRHEREMLNRPGYQVRFRGMRPSVVRVIKDGSKLATILQ